tara:strand:- start:468 stop:1031 length:564 start_codon:yes stop_codon:yes gene_type:complete
MRIISGNFRGKKIHQPNDKLTRPLKDLTKESIFNIINHSNLLNVNIKKSKVLDLFSGVGSFGLECISRGALSVTFFENYPEVVKVLKLNITNMKSEKKVNIVEKNIFHEGCLEKLNEKFELIFIDPPYKEKKLNLLLKRIHKIGLLEKNGLLIIHRHRKEINDLPKEFYTKLERVYGISKIIFLVSS